VRFGAVVLGFVAGCSFPHGSLSPQEDAPATQPDVRNDASPDGAPDAPPDSPAQKQPVTMTFPGTQDTYVDSLNQSTAFGGAANMLADGDTTPATALLYIDLSTIPTTATVMSAVLHVWVSNDTGANVNVYKMAQSWNEASATWLVRSTGVGWASPGAAPPSRETTVLATFTPDAIYAEKVGAIDSDIVQGWVTTPATNYGLAIVTADADGSSWRTRENTTVANRPILVVTYLPAQ
jgi:hypothetical protein